MADTPAAQAPAESGSTSSAKLLHQEWVHDIVVSLFSNGGSSIQRRYRKRDGTTGYANRLYPQHWPDVRTALANMEQWHAEHAEF